MSDQPWKDQSVPLTEKAASCAFDGLLDTDDYTAYSRMLDHARALERRLRAAEALLARYTLAVDSRDVNKHLAAAQAMDAGGEFPYVTEDRANSREFAKVVSAHHEVPK